MRSLIDRQEKLNVAGSLFLQWNGVHCPKIWFLRGYFDLNPKMAKYTIQVWLKRCHRPNIRDVIGSYILKIRNKNLNGQLRLGNLRRTNKNYTDRVWFSSKNFFRGQNLLLCKFLLLCYCFRTKFRGGKSPGGKLPWGAPPAPPPFEKKPGIRKIQIYWNWSIFRRG